MLADAYGYSITMPDTFGTFYDNLNPNGTLQINNSGSGTDQVSISVLGQTVYVAEGEKDVERLIALGWVATCNSGGASKSEANQALMSINLRMSAGTSNLFFSSMFSSYSPCRILKGFWFQFWEQPSSAGNIYHIVPPFQDEKSMGEKF